MLRNVRFAVWDQACWVSTQYKRADQSQIVRCMFSMWPFPPQPCPNQCRSSTVWWCRGCAVQNKEPTPWHGWPYPRLLAEPIAESSFKVGGRRLLEGVLLFLFRHIIKSLTVCAADRKAVPTHLPLAWTRSSTVEVLTFISQLEMLAKAVQAKPTQVLRDQVV